MLWALGRKSLGMEDRNTSSVPTELHGAGGEMAAIMAPRLTSSLMAGGHFPVLSPGTPGATASVRSWDIQPDTRLPDSNIIKHTRLDRNSYHHCVSRVSNPEPQQRTQDPQASSMKWNQNPGRGSSVHPQTRPVPSSLLSNKPTG